MLESSPSRLQPPRIRSLKFAMLALSATAIVLCFDYNIFRMGEHGVLAFAMCVVAAGLAGYFTVNPTMPRWASVVSAVALSIVAMKTSGDETDNIMMVAFFGMIAAIILAIRPERRVAARPRSSAA